MSVAAAVLLVVGAALVALRRRRLARVPAAPEVETWSCGFAAASPRVQYTGSSLAELLLARFTWVMFPRVHRPSLQGPFPAEAAFESHVPDTVLDLALEPAARGYAWLASLARTLYVRRIQLQMLLILATLVAVLAWGFVW